jgi:dihydrofolate reductase
VLHDWIFHGTGDHPREAVASTGDVNGQIVREAMSTGAVITGRGTFEAARGWGGDHHDGVPIYVVSRGPAPAWAAEWPAVHYERDIAAAARAARDAAGDNNVLVHGASTMLQLAVEAGVLDELEIHLIPVLLGDGRGLFENVEVDYGRLERVRVLEGERGVTHLRYRVRL